MSRLTFIALLWCGVLAALPLGAAAGTFPALYDVTGVAGDDVLNIRATPDPSSDIIGALAHTRTNIEVIRLDPARRWGLVNTGERAGWVSMRFLARQAGQATFGLTRPLQCSGTEPFWSARIGRNQILLFERMGTSRVALAKETYLTTAGRSDKIAAVWGSKDARIVGVMTQAACSDGMSDREFGIAADFLLFGTVGSGTMVSGCCSVGGN